MLLLWLTVEWTQNIKRWHEVKKVKILRGWVGGMRRWFIYWPWVFNSLMARGNKLSLNLDVLLWMLRNLLPEFSMESSQW